MKTSFNGNCSYWRCILAWKHVLSSFLSLRKICSLPWPCFFAGTQYDRASWCYGRVHLLRHWRFREMSPTVHDAINRASVSLDNIRHGAINSGAAKCSKHIRELTPPQRDRSRTC